MRRGHHNRWSYDSFPVGAKPVTYNGENYDLEELALERAFPRSEYDPPDGADSVARLIALGELPPEKVGGTVEVVVIPRSHESFKQEYARKLGDGEIRPTITSVYWNYRTRT